MCLKKTKSTITGRKLVTTKPHNINYITGIYPYVK